MRENIQNMSVWIEINMNRLRNNLKEIQHYLKPGVKIMAVVKSDAYGHGAVQVSKELQQNGVDFFAVARIEEAIELRRNEIKGSILIFDSLLPEKIEQIFEYHLIPSIYDLKLAEVLAAKAKQAGIKIPIHIKVDSGAGGLGLSTDDCQKLVELPQLEWLEIDGIYTHLTSDYRGEVDTIHAQIAQFNQVLDFFKLNGISIPHIHMASSLAIFTLMDTHYNMVRPGIALYGIPPVSGLALHLQPIMQLKSRIISIRELNANETIGSYDSKFTTSQAIRYAVVAIGYADAFFLLTTHQGIVLIRGQRVPIISQPRMNHILVDVTKISEVSVGDEVVLIGEQGLEMITAQDVTSAAGISSLNCESVCLINPKVPRIYLSGVESLNNDKLLVEL